MQAFGGDVKYILSEDEYAEQQSLQSFLNRFAAGMSKLTAYYKVLCLCCIGLLLYFSNSDSQKNLTETNYNQVFISLVDHLFKEWEKHILTLRFNLVCIFCYSHQRNVNVYIQLGATRFDEDLRSVTAYLATLTDWSFRDKFARLSQMSTILGLETLSEIFEYWGPRAGPMVWKWKAAEVRKILCLRYVYLFSY